MASPPSHRQKQQLEWAPTKLWLRSSRELVMAMHVLDEKLGQIQYRNERYKEVRQMDRWEKRKLHLPPFQVRARNVRLKLVGFWVNILEGKNTNY